jgi:hypothetical protein
VIGNEQSSGMATGVRGEDPEEAPRQTVSCVRINHGKGGPGDIQEPADKASGDPPGIAMPERQMRASGGNESWVKQSVGNLMANGTIAVEVRFITRPMQKASPNEHGMLETKPGLSRTGIITGYS